MIFLKLLLAHLIGDFILQTNKGVVHKEANRAASWYLYLHLLIHFGLPLLLLWDLSYWKLALVLALSHGVIDLITLYTRHWYKFKSFPFFLDQAAHLLVLFALASYPDTRQAFLRLVENLDWPLITGLVFVTYPAAIIMTKILEGFSERIPTDHKSLPNAGKYIGIIERLLVFLFILLDRWEAIGLLIAAKSVFRFNDLKESNNRKWTEYILIGTLLSFGLAILAGLAVRFVC
ncbi:DUF3307 domain-containing protein [Robiginitalea sp. IMCC44478]|uniref:DUF3307 domain-containing protein n=1 Tax=Robiginitalea sp. IMCC44478 TaxID=3459122 RepID=UPI00404104A4